MSEHQDKPETLHNLQWCKSDWLVSITVTLSTYIGSI